MRHATLRPSYSLLASLLAMSGLTASAAVIRVPGDQPTIQAGIHAASKGDTVLVAPGTWFESIDFDAKEITVASEAGATATTIDAGASPYAVNFQTRNRIRHGRISGFTITNASNSGIRVQGGGMRIEDNIITGTGASAVTATLAEAKIRGNWIHDNAGAGITMLQMRHATVARNRIEFNAGTGIVLESPTDTVVVRNVLRGNSGWLVSGLFEVGPGSADVADNLIVDNHGDEPNVQAGVYLDAGVVGLAGHWVNNTIADNRGRHAQQLYVSGDASNVVFANNVVSSRLGGVALACYPAEGIGGTIAATFDDFWTREGRAIEGVCEAAVQGAPGNLELDPTFQGPGPGSRWLPAAGSPLIDAGDDQWVRGLDDDIRGHARVIGGIVDMGAFEFDPD